jgi:hypothetical protein
MKTRALTVVTLLAALSVIGCKDPVARPAGGTDGTARWAFALASPKMTGDYELRQILGSEVMVADGRLAANIGSWEFVAWSPSLKSKKQITVRYDAATSESTSSEAAPGPGVVKAALSATWADSPQLMSATDGKRASDDTFSPLMVANFTDYPKTAGQSVWGITFNGHGENQLVAIDGTYISPQ